MVINDTFSNKFGNILNITHPQDKYKNRNPGKIQSLEK